MDLAEPIAPEMGERFDPIDAALTKSESTFRSPRMFDRGVTSADAGCVRWAPGKSLWITGMTAAALVGGPLYFTWGAFILFLVTTATTICLGHSLGMHRRLIHRAYDCALWLERLLVYLGTLVGMAGPYGRRSRVRFIRLHARCPRAIVWRNLLWKYFWMAGPVGRIYDGFF